MLETEVNVVRAAMAADDHLSAKASCLRIAKCSLGVSADPWPFAERSRAEIAAYWEQARAECPTLFDGSVCMLRSCALRGDTFVGTFVRTDFKSFLYWRDHGFPDRSVRDGFGSAVIRSSEGHVLLGRQRRGNVNAGLAYPPGGVIDTRDVRNGEIDIEGSIVRELAEETGLRPADLKREPGYVLTSAGPRVSIAIEWRSTLGAEALRRRILDHVGSQSAAELADVVIVCSCSQIDSAMVPLYAQVLLQHLLPA